MKQSNKLRGAFSVALCCASLLLLVSMTSCSKDAVNEETPLTKGITNSPQGSYQNPFPPNFIADINVYQGSSWRYFDMRLGSCSFMTDIPANQHGMILSVLGSATSRTINYEMTKWGGERVCENSHTVSTEETSIILRIPRAACGPYPNPPLPAERVKVTITMPASGRTGVKFTYFQDPDTTTPPGPQPPGPKPGQGI